MLQFRKKGDVTAAKEDKCRIRAAQGTGEAVSRLLYEKR